jgi:hypothetical protein
VGQKTFVEFAREKERLLERWCTSEKVANSYDNLRQLILLEEFKNSVYPEAIGFRDQLITF